MLDKENGRFMSSVKVGPKGQIVIPAEAREMFGINPGDTLILLADSERGIAIPPKNKISEIITNIMSRFGGNIDLKENEDGFIE